VNGTVNLLDATSLLSSFGTVGIAVVLFAETGLLIGLFLPGDSLLFTAGLFAAAGAAAPVHLSLPAVIVAAAIGATAGAETGYVLGRRSGPLLLRGDGRPRLRAAVERAGQFLDRYGYGKAIVLARFVPLVRTVLNPLAGIAGVPHAVFTRWQLLGGLLWTVGVTTAGYVLGRTIPGIDRYLLPIVALVVLVSLSPIVLEALRNRRARRAADR
jgi:membrane-associated protein